MVYKNKGNIGNGERAKGNGDFPPEHQGRNIISLTRANLNKHTKKKKKKKKRKEKDLMTDLSLDVNHLYASTINCSPSSSRVVTLATSEIIFLPCPTNNSFSALAGRPRYVGGSLSGSRFTHSVKSRRPVPPGRAKQSSFSTPETNLCSSSKADGVRKLLTKVSS
jgi:hypothetical protein